MPEQREEERWAAACIEHALPGVSTRSHDDGSRPSMHDLNLFGLDDQCFGSCEVTAAADPEAIELWRLVNGTRSSPWIEQKLLGSWLVSLSPRCRVKTLRAGLADLLESLEADGITDTGRYALRPRDLEANLINLGIDHAARLTGGSGGRVFFTIQLPAERSGGAVPTDGNPLVAWLDEWMNTPEQAHNAAKVAASGADERHLFVWFPGFTHAPFMAADVLMQSPSPLPTAEPRLPPGVTHLWAASTWDVGDVLVWNPMVGWVGHPKPALGARAT